MNPLFIAFLCLLGLDLIIFAITYNDNHIVRYVLFSAVNAFVTTANSMVVVLWLFRADMPSGFLYTLSAFLFLYWLYLRYLLQNSTLPSEFKTEAIEENFADTPKTVFSVTPKKTFTTASQVKRWNPVK